MENLRNVIKATEKKPTKSLVWVDADEVEILREYSRRTGLSMSRIATNFIRFAAKHTVIEQEDE